VNVHVRMIGCRLNQAEIDAMARQLHQQGHTLVDDPAHADQIIVNTCAVTADANRASRQLVRHLHAAQNDAPITVTGCYAQIAPDEVAVLPGVARVVSNSDKDRLVEMITGQPIEPFDREPFERDLPGRYARTRAFLKVQDGCDNACTFCVTTLARGEGRSRPLGEVLHEANALAAMGCSEVVLTGVHLGSYGHDRGERDGLAHLVRALLDETDLPRLRLSSLEPWDLTPDFFNLWANPRLCPHLHLPLQSGCDATLRRMARRTSQAAFSALMSAARAHIAQPCITTDVIVGFPGETDAEFEESAAFVEAMAFAGLHVFRYSRRPGTAAARMRGHVPEPVKKARSERFLALGARLERRYAESLAGQVRPVLWEQVAGVTDDGFLNVGYTDSYVRVGCTHPRPLTGQIIPAQLTAWDEVRGSMACVPLVERQLSDREMDRQAE
jgi:threonylcarbamoyladenosine tRNA methylthiotransferase MtaB